MHDAERRTSVHEWKEVGHVHELIICERRMDRRNVDVCMSLNHVCECVHMHVWIYIHICHAHDAERDAYEWKGLSEMHEFGSEINEFRSEMYEFGSKRCEFE